MLFLVNISRVVLVLGEDLLVVLQGNSGVPRCCNSNLFEYRLAAWCMDSVLRQLSVDVEMEHLNVALVQLEL